MKNSPSTPQQFDAIVVGTGQAGPMIATHLASQGQRVALIERDKFGGTCLNEGCRPTKALRASARAAFVARNSAVHGVTADAVRFDIRQAMARMRNMIDRWREGFEGSLRANKGLEIVLGHARFTGTDDGVHRLVVGDRALASKHVVLNVGGRARIPDIPGLDTIEPLTNESILRLQEVPDHLIVVGGSYIGLEFAQIFRRFGSRVTVIEASPHVIAQEDEDVSQEIERFLTDEGIDVYTSAPVARVGQVDGGIEVSLQDGTSRVGSHLLVATGRVPNTDRLDLDRVGLAPDRRGFLRTDGTFHTEVDGIVAVGDINGRGAFTHTAYQDGEIYVDHLQGGRRTADGRVPTYALFTDPPLGRVGMNDRGARESGRKVLRSVYPMAKLTKGVLDGETNGLIKLLVDAESEQILGATCLGLHGDEIVQIVGALIHAGASYRVLETMLPIHPTVSEFYPTLVKQLRPLD